MILYYIAPGQGQTTPWGQNFDVNRKPLPLCPFVASLKKEIWFYTFLMILYMYIAPGQGQTTPWGQTFDVNRKPLSLCPFVAGLKKIALKSDFIYSFFHFSPYVYSPVQGHPIHWVTTERPFLFAHMLQVSTWSLRNLILYTFLMILYMYIALGQGQKTPWGQTFDVKRKPLSLRPFIGSFKQISLNSDIIHIF